MTLLCDRESVVRSWLYIFMVVAHQCPGWSVVETVAALPSCGVHIRYFGYGHVYNNKVMKPISLRCSTHGGGYRVMYILARPKVYKVLREQESISGTQIYQERLYGSTKCIAISWLPSH